MCQSTAVVPFQFQSSQIRTVTHRDEHWFVAKDVCSVLGIESHRDAVAALDEDERDGVGITDAIGRKQKTTIVNESGLYALIFKSRKPDARQFRKWVTGEVLPALRKTGRYAAAGHAARRRFIAAIDHEGRMSMTELGDEMVVSPKNLARVIADPNIRFAADPDEHRRLLAEILAAAAVRSHRGADAAHELLYGRRAEQP